MRTTKTTSIDSAEFTFLSRTTPAQRLAARATTIICGACEHEWSADSTSSRTCAKCGNDGDIETHAVRQEAR